MTENVDLKQLIEQNRAWLVPELLYSKTEAHASGFKYGYSAGESAVTTRLMHKWNSDITEQVEAATCELKTELAMKNDALEGSQDTVGKLAQAVSERDAEIAALKLREICTCENGRGGIVKCAKCAHSEKLRALLEAAKVAASAAGQDWLEMQVLLAEAIIAFEKPSEVRDELI